MCWFQSNILKRIDFKNNNRRFILRVTIRTYLILKFLKIKNENIAWLQNINKVLADNNTFGKFSFDRIKKKKHVKN